MKIPTITLMDGDGFYVWTGTLTQFARDNGSDTAREVIAQFRASERDRVELIAALEGLLRDKYLADPINNDRMANARATLARVKGET